MGVFSLEFPILQDRRIARLEFQVEADARDGSAVRGTGCAAIPADADFILIGEHQRRTSHEGFIAIVVFPQRRTRTAEPGTRWIELIGQPIDQCGLVGDFEVRSEANEAEDRRSEIAPGRRDNLSSHQGAVGQITARIEMIEVELPERDEHDAGSQVEPWDEEQIDVALLGLGCAGRNAEIDFVIDTDPVMNVTGNDHFQFSLERRIAAAEGFEFQRPIAAEQNPFCQVVEQRILLSFQCGDAFFELFEFLVTGCVRRTRSNVRGELLSVNTGDGEKGDDDEHPKD